MSGDLCLVLMVDAVRLRLERRRSRECAAETRTLTIPSGCPNVVLRDGVGWGRRAYICLLCLRENPGM